MTRLLSHREEDPKTLWPGVLQSFPQAEQSPTVRTLQIEADGDHWKGLIKPKIRLRGRWLEQVGFPPGHRVQ